jgi:glycosyltransferase involved in cell wall biosynthesis
MTESHFSSSAPASAVWTPRPAPVFKKLALRGPLDGRSSYSQHLHKVARDFRDWGVPLQLVPPQAPVTDYCELLIHPPTMAPVSTKTCWFTMTESSAFTDAQLRYLRGAAHVVVPCAWNKEALGQGCLYAEQVPLGADPEVFRPQPARQDGLCVFGTGGRLLGQGARKRVDQVIAAFQQEFKFDGPDVVRLEIKCFPDDPLSVPEDPRIVVYREFWTEERMAEWYAGLTAFVSASMGEAWGLMVQQAMMVGRPVLTPLHGGVKEFLGCAGHLLRHREVPASFGYAGTMGEVSNESLQNEMVDVYARRCKAICIGMQGMQASAFTWRGSNARLLALLRQWGYV